MVDTNNGNVGIECDDSAADVLTEQLSDRRSGMDQRSSLDRRSGLDTAYAGTERRKDERRANNEERRSGWDRRRGPGRRRSNERRSAEEGEMNDEQFLFIKAIEEYKRVNKRSFPSYTEVLEILKALGYRKVAKEQPLNTYEE